MNGQIISQHKLKQVFGKQISKINMYQSKILYSMRQMKILLKSKIQT
jgi:hypothetical protein